MVEQLRHGFEQIQADGTLDQILSRYHYTKASPTDHANWLTTADRTIVSVQTARRPDTHQTNGGLAPPPSYPRTSHFLLCSTPSWALIPHWLLCSVPDLAEWRPQRGQKSACSMPENFWRNNLFEPLTAEDIAASAAMSLRSLQRHFADSVGESLASYVRGRRLTPSRPATGAGTFGYSRPGPRLSVR